MELNLVRRFMTVLSIAIISNMSPVISSILSPLAKPWPSSILKSKSKSPFTLGLKFGSASLKKYSISSLPANIPKSFAIKVDFIVLLSVKTLLLVISPFNPRSLSNSKNVYLNTHCL